MASSIERENPDDAIAIARSAMQQSNPVTIAYRFPWWALILLIIGVLVVIATTADEDYARIFNYLQEGIGVTLRVSIFGYVAAMIIGLIVGLIRSNPPQPAANGRPSLLSFLRLVLYNGVTMYVEVMRGLPIAIVILVTAFVIAPPLIKSLEASLGTDLNIRSGSEPTVTMGLALAYGAFLSEIFRAGIQSVEKGQREAARALGLTYFQVMRHVVLPQAVRRILPTLGNDFIAIIKDSSLVALVGVEDVTQLAKKYSGSSFKYVETYLVVALIYLTMTIIGSVLVQLMERYMKTHER